MGTVFEAVATRTRKDVKRGRRVAVKILHPHLADDPEILRRFRREARLGREIRHERVVAVLDHGTGRAAGREAHYLVMELLRGRTLRDVMDWEGPLEDRRVIEIGQEVAEGLAAIHRAGAVHRDIKPANLFVEANGVKIADLGLSRLLTPRTEISMPGTILGSLAYAAPEQLEGRKVTGAADLYALGVTLYELASGHNPFRADDMEACIRAHLTSTPPPLGELGEHHTWFLERVLIALLQRDPEQRLGPASRVARVLEQRERSDFWRDFVGGEGPFVSLSAARRRLRVRRASRLRGRAAECAAVLDVAKTALVGRSGGVAVVVGKEGIGRTRLIDEALERLEREVSEPRIAVSRFLDQATPVPYFAWNEVILQALSLDGQSREDRRADLIEGLRRNLPERAVFAEALASLVDDKDPSAEVERLPPEVIPALYAEAIRTMSAREGLVVVLEELQWGDRGSLRVLRALVPALAAFPLALVLSARVGSGSDGETVADHLRWLRKRKEVRWIELGPIDRRAVRRLLRDLAVPAETEKLLAARLHAITGGNPGFLFGIVEELERQGQLRDPRHRELRTLPLPADLVDLFKRRLDELDEEARRLLEFASVFGVRFKLEPVVEGLRIDLMSASEAVARLRRQYQLIRPGDGAYRFEHHVLREQVYRSIPAARRRRYHAIVGALIAREAEDPHAASRSAYEAGIHFSLGHDHRGAARYLVGAARYLASRSLHERAERLAMRAREHAARCPDLAPADRFAIQVTIADLAGHLGRRDVQGDALRQAARIATEAGDPGKSAEIEVLLARYAGSTGKVFAALGHAERALTAAREADRKDLEAAALRVECTLLWILGQVFDEERLMQARALAEEAGDLLGSAFALLQLGRMALSRDQPSRALQFLKDAVRRFGELRDERGRGRAFFEVARVYREFGDLRRALRSADIAARIAEANSDRGLIARCLYLRGDLEMRRRNHDAARRLLLRARRELAAAEDPTFQVYALVALALLHTANAFEGRAPGRAARFAKRAVKLAQSLRIPRLEATAYAALATAYLAGRRRGFALAVSNKGVRLVERENVAGRKRASEIFFIHYRCLKALGRFEDAREYLRRARDLVYERAAEIEQPKVRAWFLSNEVFNAAVLREARRVLGDAPEGS